MTDFAKLQSLFEQACELPPDQQAAFVDEACAGDAALHTELSDLLATDEVVRDHTARKAVGDLSALLQAGQPDALVGAQVGRYTLVSCVGVGGMGSVYLAERNDGVVQQRVAIKFLGRDLLGDGFRQRFEIEREILAKLDHPNITRLIDAEELPDGTPYYVMDYVEGKPITRYAFDQELDVNARLKLFVEVAKAVAHAHQALIVHRDIKPGNILVDGQGAPHLLDFGIAKPLAQLGAQIVSMTVTGQRFFSPQHAAPEQLLGGNITVGCDVYGLGCLLYELLSGEPAIPLIGLTAAEAEKKILHELPQAPSQRVGQGEKNDERAAGFGSASVKAWSKAIKGELDSIALTCLRKLPHERYRSVDELITDVEAFLVGMPIAAKSSDGWYRTKKFVARHRWAVTAAVLTGVALISSSVVTALQSREASFQRDAAQTALGQAEQQRDRAQRVTQFLIDAFAAANPGGELGKSVTAKDILDHGAQKLETDLQDQPYLKAQLLSTISEAQRVLSLFADAQRTAEQAVSVIELSRDESEDSDPGSDAAAYGAYAALARVHVEQRNLEPAAAAVGYLRRLAISPTETVNLADIDAQLMLRDGRSKDPEIMVPMLRRTLAEYPLQKYPEVKTILFKLRYWLVFALAQIEEKGDALIEARALVEDIEFHGISDKAAHVDAIRFLAYAERINGMTSEAFAHANRALEMAEQVFGENSNEVVSALGTLANVHYAAGNTQERHRINKQVVEMTRKMFGANSTHGMTPRFNLASSAFHAGIFDEAADELDSLIRLGIERVGPSSSSVFMYRDLQAKVFVAKNACAEAISMGKMAIDGFSKNSESEFSNRYRLLQQEIDSGELCQ